QQTLRATIDWSYNLLNEAERLLLQRLSIFAGGCTLEAAEAVCSGYGLEPSQVLDVLASLNAKSLVNAGHQAGEAGGSFALETIRQSAREKLRDAGESARLYARLRDYFLKFAEPNWRWGIRWGMLAKKLEAERANVRQALRWSFDEHNASGDIAAGP